MATTNQSASLDDVKLKTAAEVRNDFNRAGQSIAEWARKHGFAPYLVHQVLTGRSQCSRGKTHAIAVLLKLKDGYIAKDVANEEITK